jgi:hypothetical protein
MVTTHAQRSEAEAYLIQLDRVRSRKSSSAGDRDTPHGAPPWSEIFLSVMAWVSVALVCLGFLIVFAYVLAGGITR